MSRAIILLPLYAFMAWTRTTLWCTFFTITYGISNYTYDIDNYILNFRFHASESVGMTSELSQV